MNNQHLTSRPVPVNYARLSAACNLLKEECTTTLFSINESKENIVLNCSLIGVCDDRFSWERKNFEKWSNCNTFYLFIIAILFWKMEIENNFDCINLRHFLKKKFRKLKTVIQNSKEKLRISNMNVILKNL